MSEVEPEPQAPPASVEERLTRIEQAILTLGYWLVDAPSRHGEENATRIKRILDGKEPPNASP